MRRWLLCPLALAVLLWCLCALPALGQSMIDPNDNFDDGVIDTAKWEVYADPGTSLVETGGKLVMTQEPMDPGPYVVSRANSRYRLRGAFDIQVDYELTGWPPENRAAIAFCASPLPQDENALQRISWPGSGEFYGAVFNAWTGGQGAAVGTSDMAGKLRFIRDAGNVLFGYFWQASTSEWVLLHSEAVSADDLVVGLYCLGPVLAPVVIAFDNFQVNSGEVVQTAPTIEDVQIDRGRDTDWWDWPMWHERFVVRVKGTQYEQPVCLLVQDPQGACKHLPTCGADACWASVNPGGSCDFRVTAGPDYTYTYVWYEARKEHPIPEGSYQITVFGSAGSRPTLTTAVVPAVPEEGPVLLGPAADGVVDTTVPTFEWLSLPGAQSTLRLRAEGATNYTGPLPEQDDCGEIWRASVDGKLAAVYNFYGSDPGPDLEPGRTYFWQISEWTPVDDRMSDPRVSIWNDQTARHRFTIDTTWPELPALPGLLAYEQTMYGDEDPYNLQAILQYGTSPEQRRWVGPDASHTPSYSWDGTKIAYRISDWAIRVANADGSDPVRLPANWAWDSADLSPDATWVTYSDGEWQGSSPQHIFIHKLFEPTRTLLVASRGKYASRPRWSPDGKWIAYTSCCDPSGNNIWMIHPDGTQDHPVVPTTLAGHPGWTITWLGSAVVWSPDAARLGVNFNAWSADGSSFLDGVGTISADGGELTPVFTNPPGHVCCATANALCWSPDGGSLVFTSAHHLPVNPDWANGILVPEAEVWMSKADGTGEPVRLTYDYSYPWSAAWWAPNTPVGLDTSVVKGDATLTFAQVTAEGSTRMHVTSEVPGSAPAGYRLVSDIWSAATTASYQGDITVALKYDASLAGQEDTLALMEWNAEEGEWQNITAHPIDTINRITRGQTKSLGLFIIGQSVIDVSDNFDDGVIDTARWNAYGDPGTSISETGGKLVLTQEPTDLGRLVVSRADSRYRLRGAFDIQVDYELTEWPPEADAALALCASPLPEDENALQRASWSGSGEFYAAIFNAWTGGQGVAVSTADMAGKLRLVRDANNVLFGYFWQASTSEWVLLHSEAVSADDLVVGLYLLGNVHAPVAIAFDNFQVNSGEAVSDAPTIEDVQIDRGQDADWWDWPMWHERYTVQVKGTQYEQPSCILIQDPQGDCKHLPTCGEGFGGCWASPNPGGSCDYRVTVGPDYTYTYVWYEARKEHPIPEGSYQITVFGNAGSRPTLTTAVVPAVPEEGPVLLGPAADGVVDTSVPTFEWLSVPGAQRTLRVRAEGATNYTGPAADQDDCGEIWRAELSPTAPASAVYNFDGTGPDLDPGRTYFWQISDWTPVDDRVSDPRVAIWNDQTARHRFTVNTTWPGLPDLPGRLIYEQTMYGDDNNNPYNLQAILQYGTSPSQRKWVGPDASHTPSYSWDGTKIAYHLSDWGTRVANADGSDPVRLPTAYGWSGPDFSPDATWLTYADGEHQGWEPQHIYIQKLFEPERTLLVWARGDTTRNPHWSPDGVWIAYLSCCDPSGNNIWMVHPDGTQDHPVVPTTLAGHPDWIIGWLGSAVAWSPDAARLGVNFSARSADGSSFLDGIGTISPDGGELTPVFTTPPGHVCCAAASTLCWSPDGESLVFTSAHHLPVNPDWADGVLEPGAEVWMSKADGTGDPVRLTYDYSHNPSAAWWAPNTPVGRGVAVVKGDATVTFAQVTAEGSTRMNVTSDVPGPAPAGYSFVSDIWSGATTAGYQGDITVALKYDASLAGQEDALALMEWNPEKAKWQSITAHPIDAVNRIIRGQTKGLGTFAICLKTR